MIISVKRIILVIVALLVLVGLTIGVALYMRVSSGPKAVQNELTQLIQTRDGSRIEQLAMNEETRQFLLKLYATSKIMASDKQDSVDVNGVVTAYFPCLVGGLNMNVYMKATEKTWKERIFPHWALYKISLQPAHITPTGDVQPGKVSAAG